MTLYKTKHRLGKEVERHEKNKKKILKTRVYLLLWMIKV